MSAITDRSDAIFTRAQRAREEPPEETDLKVWLEETPVDFCPWCGTRLLKSSEHEWTGHPFCPKLSCMEYDSIVPEAQNRERYALQREREFLEEQRNGSPD